MVAEPRVALEPLIRQSHWLGFIGSGNSTLRTVFYSYPMVARLSKPVAIVGDFDTYPASITGELFHRAF